MDIKNRLYPYPVLAAFNDDYIDSSFRTEVEDAREGFEIVFNVQSWLENDDLCKMIRSGEAEFLYHIECSRTGYRAINISDKYQEAIRISDSLLNGEVHFCSFVVAKKELHNYVNSKFNPDNNDPVALIEKGGILAIGTQTNFNIIKRTTDLLATSSPFKIVLNPDDSVNNMVVEYESEKRIRIKLCRKDMANYKAMVGSGEVTDILNSAIVVPALVYVLTELSHQDADALEANYSDLIWYQAIKESLKKNFNMDIFKLSEANTYELAQKMLKIPINSALENLVMSNPNNHVEEDDD